MSAFNAAHVEYLIVGAYALSAHGLPRATGDMDLWIRPAPDNAERVWRALAEFGAPLERLSHADFTQADIVVQIGVSPHRIDLLTSIDGVAFDEAWPERVAVPIDGLEVPVISRRHLITNKRATGRPQDLADIARLGEASR